MEPQSTNFLEVVIKTETDLGTEELPDSHNHPTTSLTIKTEDEPIVAAEVLGQEPDSSRSAVNRLVKEKKPYSGPTHHLRRNKGEKLFPCNLCDKSFSQKSNLVTHVRRHTGQKPYPCYFCKKSFSVKDKLVIHVRSHTGEKPYPCYFCDKSFSVKCNLMAHVRCHTGKQLYPCSLCDKSFSQKSNLRRHVRSHTGA